MTGTRAGSSEPPLRVAQVVRSASFAGVERYITYVAPELIRRGLDVVVLGGDGQTMRDLLPPAVTYGQAATTLAVARGLLRLRPFEVVHAHMTAAELAAAITSSRTGAPLVATRHFAERRGRSPLGRLAAPILARNVRREIAVSRFVLDGIGRPATVLPNGVPERPLSTNRRRIVLMAQRLEAEKEVEVGIRAWAEGGLADRGWRMIVAGEGAQAAKLRALALEVGVAETIDFVGRLPDLDQLLAEAGVFLATARAEPFGLSVVEAMAHGLPVVASAAGAHLETVGACTTDWLFPAGDHRACAERLGRLVSDDTVRARYGRELRAVQQRDFSVEGHVDRLVEIYRSVLAEAPSRDARARGWSR